MNMKANQQPPKPKQGDIKTEQKPIEPPHKPEKAPAESSQKKEKTPAELTEEIAHWKDMALRATAEAENIKKRSAIDIAKANRYAMGAFAKDLLPVADSLEQALSYTRQEIDKEKSADKQINPVLENLLKGVEMTANNLTTALKKQQIERVDSLGKVFDPNIHKVIQEIEDPSKPAGTIVQELQPGYTIGGDRVLREALVIVSK